MANYIVIAEVKANIVHGYTVPPRIKCEQYDGDYTRLVHVTLYNFDQLYTIPPEVKRITVSGAKPDRKGFSYDCTWDGAVVSFSIMRQMTVLYGTIPCNITLLDADGNQVSSALIVIDVERAALPTEIFASSNDFQTIIGYRDDSKLYSEYSKSYAVGHTGIREGEDEDNAEYYHRMTGLLRDNAAAYVGSPLTVTQAADMTDTNKVYVYIGDETGYTYGSWYYYDNETERWRAGGIYNSTADKNVVRLVVADMQADTSLSVGMTVRTLGYKEVNDGMAAMYQIVDVKPDTYYESLANGLYAKRLYIGEKNKKNDSFRYNFDMSPSIVTARKIKEGVGFFTEDNNYFRLQGSCYNPTNNHIYIIVGNNDYSSCKLIELSFTSLSGQYTKEREAVFTTLGHGNDMTYNTSKNRLCVINENKIIIINPNTLTEESTNQIELSMSSIAYDENKNAYYCHRGGDTLLVVDANDYSTLAIYETDVQSKTMFAYSMLKAQGGFLFNNYFVRIYEKTPLEDDTGYQYTYLVFINKDNGQIDYAYKFWAENGGTEVQSGWQDNGQIILIAGGDAFTVITISADTEAIDTMRPTYYHGFERLPATADLNNRVVQGHWITLNDNDTQSLNGMPSSGASGQISLDIRQHGLNFVRQNLVDADDEMFTRVWRGVTDGWSKWTRIFTNKNIIVEETDGWIIIKFEPIKIFIALYSDNVSWDGSAMTQSGNIYYSNTVTVPFQFGSRVQGGYVAAGSATPAGTFISNFGISSASGNYFISFRYNTGKVLTASTSSSTRLIVAGKYN